MGLREGTYSFMDREEDKNSLLAKGSKHDDHEDLVVRATTSRGFPLSSKRMGIERLASGELSLSNQLLKT